MGEQNVTSAGCEADVSGNPAHHEEEKQRLEKLLQNRADVAELKDKNILKEGNVAPALAATKAELARNQLEDKLEGKLERRPDRDDLVSRGILKTQLQDKQDQFVRSQIEVSAWERAGE